MNCIPFERALRDAGIENAIWYRYPAYFRRAVKWFSKTQGLKELIPGAINILCFESLLHNEPKRLLAASSGVPFPPTKASYGYISEHHAYGQNEKQAGDYAEDLAAAMLASTLGIDFDVDESWDWEKRNI